MNIKRRVKRELEQRFGIFIFHNSLPQGINLKRDFDRLGVKPRVVFDVGANVGQSALKYAGLWPKADIYSFEPAADTFAKLKQNTDHLANVRYSRKALGDVEEEASMRIREDSEHNSLRASPDFREEWEEREQVQVTTLDKFCDHAKVPHIDFLKIDTEGYDLHVLEGANSMLEGHRIDAILAEVGLAGEIGHYVAFDKMKAWLSDFGYLFAGLYDQHVHLTRPHVRFANALFVRSSL